VRHRIRAFALHFALSATIIGLFLAAVFLVWYPHPYWISEGLTPIVWLLLGVDVGLGPTLTFAVYRPGKKGLALDLALIVAVQAAAFAYGSYTIVSERPAYVAFAVDRFTVVPAAAVDDSTLHDPGMRESLFAGPRLVLAARPDNPDERTRLLFETLAGGRDIEFRPEFYQPYPGPRPESVTARGKDLRARLADRPAARAAFEALLAREQRTPDQVVFLPLVGKRKDLAAVVDRATARPLGTIDVTPW